MQQCSDANILKTGAEREGDCEWGGKERETERKTINTTTLIAQNIK